MTIAVSEFVVLSLLSFLSAENSCVINRETIDPRFIENSGLLMPLGTDTRVAIDKMGFVNVTAGCRFSPSSSFLLIVDRQRLTG